MKKSFLGSLALSFALAGATADADDLKVITWNVAGAERDAAQVAQSVTDMSAELGDFDIVVLQEVISADQVEAAANALGMTHWAISDFSPPISITNFAFASLEVAVISNMPMTAVGEWDITGAGPNGDNFPPRTSNAATLSQELPISVGLSTAPRRGFLRVDLEDGPTVYAVHWKSSRGDGCKPADLDNALQREDQARGLALDAAGAISAGRSIILAGDFNIQAPGRDARVGTTLMEDCTPSGGSCASCGVGGKDGYDDSLDILTDLAGARILSEDIKGTFISFPTNGAIDHIIVAGPGADDFGVASAPTVSGSNFHGSDHKPVFAIATGSTSPGSTSDRAKTLILEIEARLEELKSLIEQ